MLYIAHYSFPLCGLMSAAEERVPRGWLSPRDRTQQLEPTWSTKSKYK